MTEAQRRDSARLRSEWAEAQRAPKLAAMRATRQKLPAFGSRAEVLASLQAQQSLVVCGETGCGKSTQVPQYILEEMVAAGRGGACMVLVAQPRRVAAISLAQRVAAERGEAVGRTVLHRGGWSLRLASDSLRAAEELTTAIVNVICAARSGIARYLSPGARHAFEPPGLLAQPLRCRYAVGEELRRGTYGAVLRGRCLQSCREVALKQLALKPAQGGTGQRDSPTR